MKSLFAFLSIEVSQHDTALGLAWMASISNSVVGLNNTYNYANLTFINL